jgi:hypothetical protein
MLESWNIDVLGFERIDPLFNHSIFPIFNLSGLNSEELAA